MKQDSLLFELGFNKCDTLQLEKMVSEDFEFYHDKGGITPSKAAFVQSIKNNICKLSYKPIRRLAMAGTEIYPLEQNGKLYGAIQHGIHRFYALEKDKPEYFTSIARFTHVWTIEDGKWKFLRGLSYDHQPMDTPDKGNTIFNDASEIEAWIKTNKIPALGIGIIKDGKLKAVNVYGELEKGRPAPLNTIWNVASLTKPVTAMVALKLVSMGKWNLDEPLYKYWIDPDLINDPRHKKLTSRIVLSHQTGFPNWRWNNPTKKLAFDVDPGTKYGYSGEGFEYLRRALEKKFQKTLAQLAKELVFTPLGMNDTRFFWDASMDEKRFAMGHDPAGKVYKINKNKYANAADDLLTTVEDYGKFLVAVLEGKGLSPQVFKEMSEHQVTVKEDKYFGLGWEIYDNLGDGEYTLSHGGADEGCQTLVFLLPKSKHGLIIFTNVDDGYKVYMPALVSFLKAQGQRIIDIEMKGK